MVGVDGSAEAESALRWAVEEATFRGGSVVALHAFGYFSQMHPEGGPDFVPSYGEAEAAQALAELVKRAFPDRLEIEQRVVCDLPANAVLSESKTADLLVVGARGLGGFRGLLMGSVSQRCLHVSHTPVCIVKAAGLEHAHGRDRVVVGVDGSPTSQRALEWAVGEARARHAHLEVVHSWHPLYTGAYPYAPVPIDPAPYEAAAAEVITDMVSAVDTEGVQKVVTTVACGGAAADLVDAAENAQLVVVGTKGVGGFRGMLMGSVCHSVAHHAPCPVVVIPAARPADDESDS